MKKILLIDDEANARNFLRAIIEEYDSTLKIFEAPNLLSGVALIKKETPDIVFLDIEMPEHSGLEILNFIDKRAFNFEIIFATAYDQYAIEAFELSALDYLLKPLRQERVIQAMERASQKNTDSQLLYSQLKSLETKLQVKPFHKIKLPVNGGFVFLDSAEVLYLSANSMYTKVFLTSGDDLLLTKPLKHYEAIFTAAQGFFRPHRKYMVNIHHMKEYCKKEGGYVIMDDHKTIPVSRDKKEELVQLIERL